MGKEQKCGFTFRSYNGAHRHQASVVAVLLSNCIEVSPQLAIKQAAFWQVFVPERGDGNTLILNKEKLHHRLFAVLNRLDVTSALAKLVA